jgi:hypothetical protein
VELVELAVGAKHLHLLARFSRVVFPHTSQTSAEEDRDPRVRYAIGKAKSWSSRMSGRKLWALRGKVVRGHQLAVVRYIREHVREGASLWSKLKDRPSP